MLAQLVAVLQTDIKLPMCLKVTGNLRRMGRFNETELRMLFLRSRDTHLTSLLATVPTADVFVYVTIHPIEKKKNTRIPTKDKTTAQEVPRYQPRPGL